MDTTNIERFRKIMMLRRNIRTVESEIKSGVRVGAGARGLLAHLKELLAKLEAN